MRFNNLFLAISFLCFMASCKKELPFPNIDAESFLVINSFFSPDSLMQIHISESCHVNDSNCTYNLPTDAEVLLKDQTGNLLANLENQGNGFYSPENFTLNNQTNYQLEVNHSNKSTTATGRIPKAFSCSYLSKEEGIFDGATVWAFEIEIIDNPDEENYYLMEGYIDILDGQHNDGTEEVNGYLLPHTAHHTEDVNAENNSIASGVDFITYPLRRIYLPDKNFNGQTYQTRFALNDSDIYNPEFEEFKAHLFIKSVSKEMYEYYKSLERYQISQSNLFTEPQQIYSNIAGGLGIFAGYTQHTFVVDLPVSEYRLPADIFVENNGCNSPCTIKFTTDGGPRLNYNWDFGDGNTSSEANPEHQYEASGEYIATLTISDSPGNIYGSTIDVRVN